MILARYITAIAAIDHDPVTSYLVREDLGLPGFGMPYALNMRGLGQADLVLSLLRLDTPQSRAHVETILGRPIQHCPGVFLAWRINGRPLVRRSPVIIHLAPNPRKPNTTAHQRYESTFKIGRTIQECLARGARKRDIRSAQRRGWIKVEELA